jgi:signal transduction histidine kinase
MSLQNSSIGRTLRSAPGALRLTPELDSEFASLQEELHRRIVSELHDSTCQHLIAASLNVVQLRNALSDPRKADGLCEQVDASINHALKELRSLTYLLHPQNLFEEGLKATIEQYAEGFADRTALAVDVAISPVVDRLSYEKQRLLMRVVQEALTNVYRHARATKVDIMIGVKERHFRLEIRDNGQGITSQDSLGRSRPPSCGIGLRTMQARLREMGGKLEILSAPTARHRGTSLRATFPFCVRTNRVAACVR